MEIYAVVLFVVLAAVLCFCVWLGVKAWRDKFRSTAIGLFITALMCAVIMASIYSTFLNC